MPSIPPSISCVFQPAILMYENAEADSAAVNLLVAPSSCAFTVSCSISSFVAPEMASTLLIMLSKPSNVFAESASVRLIPSSDAPCATGFFSSPKIEVIGAVAASIIPILALYSLPSHSAALSSTESIMGLAESSAEISASAVVPSKFSTASDAAFTT